MKPLLTTLILCFLVFSGTSVALAQESSENNQSELDTFVKPERNPDGTIVADKGFVPCSGADCSPCDLVVMFNTILKWIMLMVFLLFMFIAVKAGINMVVKGTASELTAAKKSFTNAFIGLLIMLSAWLMVDTLMKYLLKDGSLDAVSSGYGPWSQIQCATQAKVGIEEGFLEGDAEHISGTPAASTGGPGVTPTGKLVSYAGYQFDSAVVDKIKYIDNNFALSVSGGYRTTQRNADVGGAKNSYHLTGRAGDFTGTAAEMKKGAAWAKANGAKEVLIHNVKTGVHLHVAW